MSDSSSCFLLTLQLLLSTGCLFALVFALVGQLMAKLIAAGQAT